MIVAFEMCSDLRLNQLIIYRREAFQGTFTELDQRGGTAFGVFALVAFVRCILWL